MPWAPSPSPEEGPPAAGPTDGPNGDAEEFEETCTGQGRLQTNGSAQGRDDETENSRGESFRYAVVMITAAEGDEPAAELRLQLPGGDSEDLADLHVGDTAEFDEWTLTIRSICEDSVGFDAEVEG